MIRLSFLTFAPSLSTSSAHFSLIEPCAGGAIGGNVPGMECISFGTHCATKTTSCISRIALASQRRETIEVERCFLISPQRMVISDSPLLHHLTRRFLQIESTEASRPSRLPRKYIPPPQVLGSINRMLNITSALHRLNSIVLSLSSLDGSCFMT